MLTSGSEKYTAGGGGEGLAVPAGCYVEPLESPCQQPALQILIIVCRR